MEGYTALIIVIALLCIYLYFRRAFSASNEAIDITKFPKKFAAAAQDSDFYDVVIVGAGPSGSTAAYYLAKAGKKVLLLEKKKFPRDKICGDAVCKTAIEILHEMGIYQELIKENKALVADHGGLVSPGGLSYIGHSHKQLGEIPAAIACKRLVLDEAIAKAAARTGAVLKENSPVQSVSFDKECGLWKVVIQDSSIEYKGRVLVCADGAPSRMAIQLGLVSQPPQGSCSRSYIDSGTHNFMADGVVFYNTGLLPGYAALFKHPGDEVNYCCYIIPGNPKVTNDDLTHWHQYLLVEDPNVSRAVGKKAVMERMKVGPLRFGGEPLTYGDHVLVVGDAAGFIDPMTGEGIHTAMDSGRIAAKFLCEAFDVGNFDKELMKEYQNRWLKAWGHDFKWSNVICQFLYRYPIVLDAATAAIVRKGDKFLARWADIMTGRVSKASLLHPEFVVTIGFELVTLIFKKVFLGGYEKEAKKHDDKKKQ